MICEPINTTNTSSVKRCSKCGGIKSVSEFGVDNSRKDRLYLQCKSCVREYNGGRKEKIAITGKFRRQNSPRPAISGCLGKALKRRPTESPVTREELYEIWERQGGRCALSGIEMVWYGAGGRVAYNSMSLDRIDNEKGYIEGNVRWICHCVNAFLGEMTDAEMYEVAQALVSFGAKFNYINFAINKTLMHYFSSKVYHIRNRCSLNSLLTYSELIELYKSQGGKCALTGIELRPGGTNGPVWNSLSVDRIDYNNNYTPGNVRLVLYCINSFRGQMTDEQMYEVAKAILDYRNTL